MKLPSFQFYPGDWQKDLNLRRCTHGAKGVWIDTLCLMHESEERGVLVTGNCPWSEKDWAAAVGGNADVTLNLIAELLSKGVARKRDSDGAFYCARMVREEHKRVQTKARVKAHRERHTEECNAPCNASVTTPIRVTPEGESEEEEKEKDRKKRESEGEVGKEEVSEEEKILQHLNLKAGRKFRFVEETKKLISARLADVDGDVVGVMQMIHRQCQRWRGNQEMDEYLRPETLFGKKKFQGYYDNRELPAFTGNGTPQHRIDKAAGEFPETIEMKELKFE